MKKSLTAVVCAAVLATVFHAGVAGQQAGVNTPVLPGVPADPNDPYALLKSDLLMNRQVEPELVVSTRNPLHILAFFNDYRAVDLSNDVGIGGGLLARSGWVGRLFARWLGLEPLEGKGIVAAAEATTGMARSYDGGVTWTGGLLPGSPDDPSPAASQSPAWGLDAMTDPRAVAAPCGRAYLFNVAFTRGGASKLMVTRFEDKNDEDGGDTWHMLGQTVIETASNAPGHFHDLPYAAVDIARTPGAGACDHTLYVAWARFSGSALASKIMFAKSTDGGTTWKQNYIKSTNKTDQGLVMTVDPRPGTPATGGGGTLYVGWRTFATSSDPDGMWITSSKDFGATFGKAIPIASSNVYLYDQPSLPSTMVTPSALAFRSNSFMTLQSVPHPVDPNRSTLFASWQERVNVLGCPGPDCGKPSATGDPRIVIARSADDGLTWVDPQGVPGRRAVDFGDRDLSASPDFPKPGFGYLPIANRASGPQVLPRLSFGGGRLALGYLEGRGPLTAVPGTAGVAGSISRQFDARLALLDPATGGLLGTAQVSRYPVQVGAPLNDGEQASDILMLRQDPLVRAISDKSNAPSSGGGTTPFYGDYLSVVPTATFVLDRVTGRWRWAINPQDVPFRGFHMAFPDSRHVIPPAAATPEEQVALWPLYSPPGTNAPSCVNPGSRNHDVMHTLVDAGVPVNTIASYKELGVIARTFPVTVTNTQGQNRYFRAALQPEDVASFHQFEDINSILIEILPYSSSTRAVTVSSPTPTTSVTVSVTEQMLTACGPNQPPSLDTCTAVPKPGGDSGTVTLNLDPTNEQNVDPTATETHNPLVTNPLVTNPLVTNPLVTNPLVTNPLVTNPLVTNNTAVNPLVTNPLVTNPLVTNSALSDETVYDIVDATWKVTNLGTDGTAYLTQVALANAAALEGNYVFHLFIYRVAAAAGLDGCTTTNLNQDQLISSIPNPFAPLVTNPLVTNPLVTNPLVTNPLVTNPLVTNATFASAPADVPEEGNLRAMSLSAVSSDDGTLHDEYRDTVFVTVRGYQIVPDSALTPATTYDPTVTPPTVAVISQTTNTIDGVVDPVEELPGSFGTAPDLTITEYVPAATPLSAAPGGAVTLSGYRINNVGDGGANSPTGLFRNGFYLSSDGIIDPAVDRRLSEVFNTNDVLPAGGSFLWGGPTLTIPADVAPGSYFIGVYTDDQARVLEREEFNNQVVEPITVTAAPVLGLLQFVTQPTDATVQQGMLPAVQVLARDAQGAPVPGVQIDLSFGANPGDTGLTGAPATTNGFGIATFPNLRVGNSGVGYTLVASVASVTAASNPFNVFGFGAGNACTAPSFDVPPGLIVGSDPYAIAAGDFNGDGHTDLAVVNRGSSDVSILLGTGLGTFGTATQYSAGVESSPVAIVAADFNRDGDIDLATANDGTTDASLLRGNGDGTFDDPISFQVPGFTVSSIAAGDTNGDGRLDLVVPSVTDDVGFFGNMNVLLGEDDGGFQAGPQPLAGVNPSDVLMADFDGDGRSDIAVAYTGNSDIAADGAVAILIAGGETGFLAPVVLAATSDPGGIATGDFNDDATRDLAVVHRTGVDVFQGGPGGTFTLAATIPLTAEGRDVTVSDFNGDGLLDIVVTTAGGLETITRNSSAGFAFNAPVHTDPNSEPRGVVAGDWNEDGRADAAVANGYPTEAATVLVNNCSAFIVTNTNDSGPGSLRQVLTDANASSSRPRVTFFIPGENPHTIAPLSPLPQITRPMDIDATTQPQWSGTPVIVLNGSSAGGATGLSIVAGDSVVRGLVINGFSGSGIALLSLGGNRIQSNYIGLDVTGTSAVPNGSGVAMSSSGGNLIGGFTAADRNVISGNLSHGVSTLGGIEFGGNEVVGNYIGTNASATAAVGNGGWGVSFVTPAAAAQNVISGNAAGGIQVLQDDHRAILNRNFIGTNGAGTAAIPNGGDGIFILDAEDSIIGGFAIDAGNVVSGNAGAGIRLTGDASATTVQGNFIGTNALGTAAIGNGGGGVVIIGTFSTQLGGTTPGSRNIISGNQGPGVSLDDSRNNFILANYIGVNAAGTAALPNSGNGITLTNDSSNNFIGMADPAARNVISGNGVNGVVIQDGANNVVAGNYIGTDASGNADIGNGAAGVAVSLGPNSIGGVGQGRNVISGNGDDGVVLFGSGNGNTVQNNYIGTNAAGSAALPNEAGVKILGTSANLIGGAGAGEGNLISANLTGVAVQDGGNNNAVMNNLIGTDASAAGPLPNGIGVSISNGTENFVTGGVIAFNTGNGVDVDLGIGNTIDASIHSNGGLGIDLGVDGITPNDPADTDAGPNSLQNFPIIATATSDGSSTTITGTAFGIDSGIVTLTFYVNAACDASGNGEGQQFLATLSGLGLGVGGSAPFTVTIGVPTALGQVITATTRDHNGSTSEFSPCAAVTAPGGGALVVTNTNSSGPGSLNQAIQDANAAPGSDRITFNIPGAGPHTIAQNFPLPPITGSVFIDGPSQAGYDGVPVIVLSGQSAGFTSGLTINGGNGSRIAGLSIVRFTQGAGILIQNPSSNNTVDRSYIGVLPDGTAAGNQTGIQITNSPSNTIGGTDPLERNVISGNNGPGINVFGGAASTGNAILGNYIGTNPQGTAAVANFGPGISAQAPTTIGGAAAGAGNLISGNGQDGIQIIGESNISTVQGNIIGLDAAGTGLVRNNGNGIGISETDGCLIGGPAGARNVISGNLQNGISIGGGIVTNTVIEGNFIGTNAAGTAALGNINAGVILFSGSSANRIGDGMTTAARNIISGNQSGVVFSQAFDNDVLGNYIGTDVTGTVDLGNATTGVSASGGGDNRIRANVISGNNNHGVGLFANTTRNIVSGNRIGTTANGLAPLPNGIRNGFGDLIGSGVLINDSPDNVIGGIASISGNLISGNGTGVLIENASSSGNEVIGNEIGTDGTGTAALPNRWGVFISLAPGTTIGGAEVERQNVISGNSLHGIQVNSAPDTLIAGNRIGIGGDNAPLANTINGIYLFGGDGAVTIGGPASTSGNVIAGNGVNGIRLENKTNTFILGNSIGVVGETVVGQGGDGISMSLSNASVIGGPGDLANQIMFNSGDGIDVSGTGHEVLENFIDGNGGLGIDLGGDGVTANDPGDGDTGANEQQNFPVLNVAIVSGSTTVVAGTFNGAANTSFTVRLFQSAACDPSGNGEGARPLPNGTFVITTNVDGVANFNRMIPEGLALNSRVTATATGPGGNTSEFSGCVQPTLG